MHQQIHTGTKFKVTGTIFICKDTSNGISCISILPDGRKYNVHLPDWFIDTLDIEILEQNCPIPTTDEL